MKIKIQMWQKISKPIIGKFDVVFLFFFWGAFGQKFAQKKSWSQHIDKIGNFQNYQIEGGGEKKNKQTLDWIFQIYIPCLYTPCKCIDLLKKRLK